MNRKIFILFVIFLIQIGLAFSLYSNKKAIGAFTSNEKLIDLEPDSVDKITIEENEKPALVLKKEKGTWVLPDYYGFPLSTVKLDRFTDKLFGIKKSWPVATTRDAAKRFKVETDNFEKKITFSKEGKIVKTLFVGSSPGFRKVHARFPGLDDIYAINFSAYEAPVKHVDWVDKDFLHFKQKEIDSISMSLFTIAREDGKFVVSELDENEEIDENEMNDLISKLAELSFEEVLGKKDESEYGQSAPVLIYTLKMKSGQSVSYTFSKQKEEEYFVLKVSSHDYYFKVSKFSMEKIQKFTREKLVQVKKNKDESKEEEMS